MIFFCNQMLSTFYYSNVNSFNLKFIRVKQSDKVILVHSVYSLSLKKKTKTKCITAFYIIIYLKQGGLVCGLTYKAILYYMYIKLPT